MAVCLPKRVCTVSQFNDANCMCVPGSTYKVFHCGWDYTVSKLFNYRIRQKIRGGKLSRFINNVHYVGKTFAVCSLKVHARLCNEPYPQLRHDIKMAALWGGQCIESLWRG